jgi:DNA-binding NtrC family response regulator
MALKEILVVDDEMGIRELLSEILFDEGYRVHLAESAAQARAFRQERAPDVVLLDIWMPEMDGLALLKEWSAEKKLTMPVIMMSGHGTIETAMEAVKVGATAFLEKPIALQKLLLTISQAIQAPVMVESLRVETMENEADPVDHTELNSFLALPLREAHERFDRIYFNHQIQKENGNIARVAEISGIERTHLYRKLKQLGMKLEKKV